MKQIGESVKPLGSGLALPPRGIGATVPIPVLKRLDVVFMYEAPKAVYEAYGATVLAWGGAPRAKSAEEAAGLIEIQDVRLVIPEAGLWTVIEIRAE